MPEFSFMLVADDYAISPAVSEGISQALNAGRLSGTGAMVNRPFWRQAAARLRGDDLVSSAGVHLNLTCGAPLTKMPAFAPSGQFPALRRVLPEARRRRLPQAELDAEISAQLDTFADATGAAPAFVDGHQHVQMFPQIRETLFEALARRGWQDQIWLRDSAARPADILSRRTGMTKALVVTWLGRGFRAAAHRAGFQTNEGFAGFSSFDPAADYEAQFRTYLVAPGTRHLVMCHPGHADRELREVDPHTQSRENELAFLLSGRFLDVLASNNSTLAKV